MPFTIRTATAADRDTIVEFNHRLALETEHRRLDPATLRAGVETLLANRSLGQYFLIEAGTRVIGQIMITFEWSDWRNGRFWWIQSVYVVEDWRGRGAFPALYAYVDAQSRREPDVCGLRLYVDGENLRAQAAYRKCGMEVTDYRIMELDRSGAVQDLESPT